MGLVITISREFGSNAINIASELVKHLSAKAKKPWVLVTNQVLEDAAHLLNVRTEEISHVFGAQEKSLESILLSEYTRKKAVTDNEVKEAIRKIVRDYAERGNCIIMGRAGSIIAQDIPNSLHIKMAAHIDYRIKNVMVNLKMTEIQAQKYIADTASHRVSFLDYFNGNLPDNELVDAIFHINRLSSKEITTAILKFAESRKMI